MTVARARQTVPIGTVPKRTGLDGISRRIPTPPARRTRRVTVQDMDREAYKLASETAKTLHKELCNLELATHRKLSPEAMAVVDATDKFLRWLKR